MKKIFPYRYQRLRFFDLFSMIKLAWRSIERRPRQIISESTPKRLPNQKWLFWQSFHFSRSADAQASPNLKKVQILSKIDSFDEVGTFRSTFTSENAFPFILGGEALVYIEEINT
ncbi:MAG: hypothetical protein HKN87_09615 [Saprospiraceae bacterium]|nr:hypothetical protein [Saprospiraceae bacterium]